MASSGTVSAPSIDFKYKPRARDTVLIMGRVRIKNSAIIESGDLRLRTIRSAVFTPYDAQPFRAGGPPVLYGSVTVAGSLMNSVRVRSLRGSIVPHTGTQHVGTAPGGTMQANFYIIGA